MGRASCNRVLQVIVKRRGRGSIDKRYFNEGFLLSHSFLITSSDISSLATLPSQSEFVTLLELCTSITLCGSDMPKYVHQLSRSWCDISSSKVI